MERHRPSNMILAGGCPAKNKAMAAPDRSERVPMSWLEKPKVGWPPRRVQERRRWRRRSALLSCWVAPLGSERKTVLMVVVPGAAGA